MQDSAAAKRGKMKRLRVRQMKNEREKEAGKERQTVVERARAQKGAPMTRQHPPTARQKGTDR